MNQLTASQEFIAFILPIATALVGMRLCRWILGKKFEDNFGFGFRFAFGLGVGIVVFSQLILLSALAGVNAAALLAWTAILWGGVEVVLRAMKLPATAKSFKIQPGHAWLLLLMPVLYSWWIFGQLSTLEGTLEYDANAFWVFKAKIFYLEQGHNLVDVLRQTNLAYTHMDYPTLVPCIYTFTYGAVGGVDEFVNKVWPFWMMVSLSIAILSFARVWKTPRPLPILIVMLIAFLPATFQFIRNEGGTIPMVFCICMTTLVLVSAVYHENDVIPVAIPLAFALCFSTKLEGAVFDALCGCALLPVCLRRGWLKNKAFWISGIVAIACLIPYAFLRLTKPVVHPEANWIHDFASSPAAAIHRFPQALFLNFFARLFSSSFFTWKDNDGHLQWAGQWSGLGSLSNPELSVLPWLLFALLILSLIFKPRGRILLGILSIVTLGIFAILSFVIASLWNTQQGFQLVIDQTCTVSGRHFYPFFTALFLGTAALWFANQKDEPEPAAGPEAKPALTPAPKSKRRA